MPSLKSVPRSWAPNVDIEAGDIAASAVTAAKIADGAVTSVKMDEGLLKLAEVAISSAEILALRATPKTLVAAPGAGKALVFRHLVLLLDATATAYTETADNMAVKYENGAGDAVSQTIEATGFIDQTTDQLTVGLPVIDPIVAKAVCENKPLVLHNTGDGEYATGTGVMRAKVWYSVITTGW